MDGSSSGFSSMKLGGRNLGVRKGAWTEQEDVLLKNFIHKYGEGKWHQIPSRAGLNRCRKSCRLRWLNYLRPNIKRGEFTVDEVDLIIRLHKLLGNRWSLIAGRIQGRTANNVKNYWNTNMCKKLLSDRRDKVKYKSPPIIKPQPRTFSKNSRTYLKLKTHFTHENKVEIENNNNNNPSKLLFSQPSMVLPSNENSEMDLWWKSLIDGDKIDSSCSTSWLDQDEPIIGSMWSDQLVSTSEGTQIEQGGHGNGNCESFFDMEIWNLLDLEN